MLRFVVYVGCCGCVLLFSCVLVVVTMCVDLPGGCWLLCLCVLLFLLSVGCLDVVCCLFWCLLVVVIIYVAVQCCPVGGCN